MSLISLNRDTIITIPVITFLVAIIIHDNFLLLLPIGLFLSDLLNIVLKLFFSLFQFRGFLRPKGSKGCGLGCDLKDVGGEPGFPSGHAQNIWFFCIFMLLYYHKVTKDSRERKLFVIGCYLALAGIVSFSRLGILSSLGNVCHSPLQVIAGSLLGIFLGWFYFKLVKTYLT